jgi:drug/metabolite transporter (DMT)-like permease
MALDPMVTLLVLLAAVMHASWNALVKANGDRLAMQALVIFFSSVPAAAALPFVPLPATASLPFLLVSLIVHGFYYATLLGAYRHGDLSQVYPIARGAAPLMVALGAWAFAGEAMNWQGWLGVIIVSLAIMSLAAPGRIRHERELPSIGFALATGVTIALYSLADGMGVRRAGDDFSYILWLLAIEGLPLLLVSFWLRRGRIRASFVPALPKGIGGGILAGLGYGIVIWAMGRAPMAHVSALRETSVILAAVIGTMLLREPFGLRRIMASGLIVAGSALLHLAG